MQDTGLYRLQPFIYRFVASVAPLGIYLAFILGSTSLNLLLKLQPKAGSKLKEETGVEHQMSPLKKKKKNWAAIFFMRRLHKKRQRNCSSYSEKCRGTKKKQTTTEEQKREVKVKDVVSCSRHGRCSPLRVHILSLA